MTDDNNRQDYPETSNREMFPRSRTDYGLLFVGLTIGNLIGDELFETNFTPIDAAPRAAITVGLIYGVKKAVQLIRG